MLPRLSLLYAARLLALSATISLTACSTFLSRGPDNAGGEIARGGPFVGTRFAYNSLYGQPKGCSNHLPKKILSPIILVADGTPSALADILMLPFDWNGGTVPNTTANQQDQRNTSIDDRLSRRLEKHESRRPAP